MELVGDMLLSHLSREHAETWDSARLCPPMLRRFSNLRPESRNYFNADRIINRFWDYDRWLRTREREFDLFHVVDHSYGQLVHRLPAERTVITCHDLDAFQCLLHPEREPRSFLFRTMMRRTLKGFRKAAFVTCDSEATLRQLLAHDLIPRERTAVVLNGVPPSCSPESNPAADALATELIGPAAENHVDVLHVGSTVPRKRIDLLLAVFATVKLRFPRARLLRVGGAFTVEQERLARKLGLRDATVVLPFVEREVLAALYRRADLVLLTSEREGFGLPLAEAMACGTPVVASDLPVLHEVGGETVEYCPVGDVEIWGETVTRLLTERDENPEHWRARRAAVVARATRFSWSEYATQMVRIYENVLRARPEAAPRTE